MPDHSDAGTQGGYSTSCSHTWGTTAAERRLIFPCDSLMTHPEGTYYRGVTVEAPPPDIFRWLCQLRVAPYSYDWIDNGGRQSPRQLTPGLDALAVGQELMTIFELVDFARDHHLTMRIKHPGSALRVFGDIAGSYLIVPKGPSTSRLLVKLLVRYPRGVRGWAMRTFLPWGDLVMMRRQLLTLRSLAEQMAGATRP